MICAPCAMAADARAPRDAHCDDPGCTCGHKTDRYRQHPALAALATLGTAITRAARSGQSDYDLAPASKEN